MVANKNTQYNFTYTAEKKGDLCMHYSEQPVLVFKMRR